MAARVLVSRTLNIHPLCYPCKLALLFFLMNLLPGFIEAKDTGLLPRSHAAILARLLPELRQLALII